ncbi:MAG: hypothetical protein AAGF10_05705, partial [Verrucomicrobiota bacterium]
MKAIYIISAYILLGFATQLNAILTYSFSGFVISPPREVSEEFPRLSTFSGSFDADGSVDRIPALNAGLYNTSNLVIIFENGYTLLGNSGTLYIRNGNIGPTDDYIQVTFSNGVDPNNLRGIATAAGIPSWFA